MNKSLSISTLITISYYYTRATPGRNPENRQENDEQK